MSSTNCRLPSSGFCLNLRVRMVNSGIVPNGDKGRRSWGDRGRLAEPADLSQ